MFRVRLSTSSAATGHGPLLHALPRTSNYPQRTTATVRSDSSALMVLLKTRTPTVACTTAPGSANYHAEQLVGSNEQAGTARRLGAPAARLLSGAPQAVAAMRGRGDQKLGERSAEPSASTHTTRVLSTKWETVHASERQRRAAGVHTR
eukprot:6173199-Pleurochrysis_carterae.AAC.2